MNIAIIGGGPAGLMAAEVALAGGAQVALYDSMPSVGRKFLLAGKGGLNLTHSDPSDLFLSRYGEHRAHIAPWFDQCCAAIAESSLANFYRVVAQFTCNYLQIEREAFAIGE